MSTHTDFFLNCMLIASAVAFPLMLRRAIEIGGHGPTGVFLIDLRLQMVILGKASYGVLAYFGTVGLCCAALHVLVPPKRFSHIRQTAAIAIAIGYAILSTGRTFYLMALVLIGGVFLITRRIRASRGLVISTAVMLAIYFVLAVIMHKGGDERASLADNMVSLWRMFRLYLLGALPAFDQFTHVTTRLGWGENTFRFVWAVLDAIGLHTPPVALIQPYTRVPVGMSTNVYTVYQPYFADFSYVGATVVQFFLGLVHGKLYRRAVDGSAVYVFAYALSLYPLVLQFFQDQYLSLLSTWIQYAVLLMIFVLICQPRAVLAGSMMNPERHYLRPT